jgi:hypothetical protein
MKMKFETCFKLKIGVNNVDTFVDKNVLRYRFCGVLLSTWDNLGGQVLFLILLMVPVFAVFGVVFECGQDQVLFAGAVGILSGSILIFVDKGMNLSNKKKMLRINLLDYLENFCKVKLDHPELFEQYRREFVQSAEANKQLETAATAEVKEDTKDELNRRREARRKKEEERKLQAIKREEEQKRLEEARKEEEKRKIEERRQLAARRREEERLKMEEEREALEARRAELKRKAEEKQQAVENKQVKAEEKVPIVQSLEEEIKSNEGQSDMDMLMKGLEEIAAEKEQEMLLKSAKAQNEKETADKQKSKAAAVKVKIPGMSPQEEKVIEDVLKEFFA